MDPNCYPTEIFLDEAIAKKICPIGCGVFNNAVLDKYGYTYCESCINRWLDTKTECPLTKQPLYKDEIFINRGVREEIYEANVICLYSNRGCEWTGKLINLNNHITSSCLFVRVQCPACLEDFPRNEASIHYDSCPERIIICEFCSWPRKSKNIKVNIIVYKYLYVIIGTLYNVWSES